MKSSQGSAARGMEYSAALHGVLLLMLIFGLPSFLHRNLDTEPEAISVDILPIAEMSNVKPEQKNPEKENIPEAQKETAKKETLETTKEEEKPEENPVTIPAKDTEKKKPEKKKPKKKEESLESILKSVKETAKKEEAKNPSQSAAQPNTHAAVSQNYNPAVPLSMSEKDAIRNQFQKCWDVPAGARDAANLIVTLHIEVNADGSVTKVELVHDESRYNADTFFRAAADSAIRAVNRCSPLKNLPADKYGSWSDMELTFDPKEMLY